MLIPRSLSKPDLSEETFRDKVMKRLPGERNEPFTIRSRDIPRVFFTLALVSMAVIAALTSQMSAGIGGSLEYVMFESHPSLMRMLSDDTVLQSLETEKPIGAMKSTTIIHGIFSTTSEEEKIRRQRIRDTYLSNPDDRLCSLTDYMNDVKEKKTINLRCQVAYTFVIGGGAEERPTEHYDDTPVTLSAVDVEGADETEEDVMYLNIKENMENGKSLTYFKATAALRETYGIDYISKTDSDSIFSMEHYFTFTEGELAPAPYNRRMYGGPSWGNFVKSSVYAAGQYYFMSSDLAHYVSNIMTHEQRLELTDQRPTEDMDMGTFVFSHPRPIKFVNLSPYTFWLHPLKTEEEWMNFWENDMNRLPQRAPVLPYFHLCPAWKTKQFF